MADIDTKTLAQFDEYARGHADWASDPLLPAPRRAQLIRLLEWARGGPNPPLTACGAMKVTDLEATGLGAPVLRQLDTYARAVRATDTLRAPATAVVAEARDRGDAVTALEGSVAKSVLNHVMGTPPANDQFLRLITDGQVANFANYVRRGRPALEAPDGADVRSYLDMVASGTQPESFIGNVPHIRNFHRFLPGMLNTIKANWGIQDRAKPLQLILHSGSDHNGAFHRDAELEVTVQHTRNLTLMVEGVARLESAGTLAEEIARDYGQRATPRGPGRINQLMLAGHGSSQLIELGATVGPGGRVTGMDSVDLAGNRRRSDAFLRRLGRLMGGANSRIALNACLTASDEVAGPLSPDPAVAAAQIRQSLRDHPSLATRIEQIAGPGVTVQGNLSSVGAGSYTDPATGLLDQKVASDPAATLTDRAEYIEHGLEAEGCMRAVVRVWATDKAECIRRVEAWRTAHASPADWDQHVIKSFYDQVVAHPDDVNLMNRLANSAFGLSEFDLLEEQKPSTIDAMHRAFSDAELNAILTPLHAVADAGQRLGLNALWMHKVPARSAEFMTALDTFATPTAADRHLQLGFLTPKLATLLPIGSAGTPSAAQAKLALWCVIGDRAAPHAVDFLKAGATPTNHLALGGATPQSLLDDAGVSEDDVLRTIGILGPASAPAPGGATPDPPNVDTDGDGVYDLRVEPMTRHGATTARRLNVRARPEMAGAIVGTLPARAAVYIIGRSGDWFAIEHGTDTRFVHQRFVRLAGTP